MSRLQQRTKPDRPTEIANDGHWKMIEKCWADVPQQRPAAGVVYQNVQQLHLEAERDRRPQEGEQQLKETVRKRKRSLKVQEERKRRAITEEAMQQREKQEWMQKGEIEQSATHDDEGSIATIREVCKSYSHYAVASFIWHASVCTTLWTQTWSLLAPPKLALVCLPAFKLTKLFLENLLGTGLTSDLWHSPRTASKLFPDVTRA